MENPPKPLKFAPKVALAVCIGLLDDNYKKVAYHLNDKGWPFLLFLSEFGQVILLCHDF